MASKNNQKQTSIEDLYKEGVVDMKRLVQEISKKEEIDAYYVGRVLDAMKETIKEHLIEGRDVDLGRDFGKLVNVETQGRQYVVPKTGEKRISEPTRKIRFRASTSELRSLTPLSKD